MYVVPKDETKITIKFLFFCIENCFFAVPVSIKSPFFAIETLDCPGNGIEGAVRWTQAPFYIQCRFFVPLHGHEDAAATFLDFLQDRSLHLR